MANITVTNLQPTEFEFAELSDLELEAVVGGKNGFLNIGNWGPSVDRAVRRNVPGGWIGVARGVVSLL
ncbi:hypothetical protein V0288_24605 [Pannus brasiliensis CCIBt3594]|uniref:Bacteriocin n=1 Tax=Pannus brasiliensis CCIBt3594 TaxID=1427578 RepID=A0AAW9R1G7_9CHRO